MIKVSRRAVTVAAALLALGAGSATWATTSASAATAARSFIPRCGTSQLAAWVNADSADGTAGTTFYHLDLTNTGHRTCWLYGWPGVSAASWAGHQLGIPAARRNDVRPQIVNVVPGGTAHAALGYVDVQLSPSCSPATAAYLRVYPPGNRTARHAFFPLPVCTDRTQDLTIGRFQPGA